MSVNALHVRVREEAQSLTSTRRAMATRRRILGLDSFHLTPASLTRLGRRPVRLQIDLAGETVSSLRHLRPQQRLAVVRDKLVSQLNRLQRTFPAIEFIPRCLLYTSDAADE